MFDYTRNRAGVPLNSSFSEFILTKKYRVSILLLWHDFRSAISKWINHSREYTWLAENSMIVIVTTAIDGCPALVKHPRRDFSCINARWFALGTCTNFAHRPVAQRTHGGRSFVYMTWHDIVRRGMCISFQCATTTTATTIYTQININFQRRLQSSVQFAMTNEAEQMPFYRSFSFVLRRSLDWLNRHTHTHTPSNNRGCAFLCLHFMNKYQQLKSVIYNWSIPELNVRRVEFWTSVDCGGQEWSGEWWYAVRKRIRTRSAAQLILFAVRSNASILMFRNQLQRLNVDWRTGNISK